MWRQKHRLCFLAHSCSLSHDQETFCSRQYRGQDNRQVRQKPGTIGHHAHACTLRAVHICWSRHLLIGLNFFWHSMNTVLKNLQTQVHHLRGLENTLLFFSLAPAAFSLFTKHLAAFANIPRVFPASSISSALTRTLPMPAGCFPSSSGDVQVLVTHRKEVCCTGRDLGACWWSCVVLTTYPVQAVDRSESCPVL